MRALIAFVLCAVFAVAYITANPVALPVLPLALVVGALSGRTWSEWNRGRKEAASAWDRRKMGRVDS
jgi:hypothetical protein